MEASGANNSEYCMFQYAAFITLDFQKVRNLGMKYWVSGVARKLGFGENSVWSIIPRLARERGYQTCWRGELRAQPEPRTQSARESMAKPEIERGEGVWEGAR